MKISPSVPGLDQVGVCGCSGVQAMTPLQPKPHTAAPNAHRVSPGPPCAHTAPVPRPPAWPSVPGVWVGRPLQLPGVPGLHHLPELEGVGHIVPPWPPAAAPAPRTRPGRHPHRDGPETPGRLLIRTPRANALKGVVGPLPTNSPSPRSTRRVWPRLCKIVPPQKGILWGRQLPLVRWMEYTPRVVGPHKALKPAWEKRIIPQRLPSEYTMPPSYLRLVRPDGPVQLLHGQPRRALRRPLQKTVRRPPSGTARRGGVPALRRRPRYSSASPAGPIPPFPAFRPSGPGPAGPGPPPFRRPPGSVRVPANSGPRQASKRSAPVSGFHSSDTTPRPSVPSARNLGPGSGLPGSPSGRSNSQSGPVFSRPEGLRGLPGLVLRPRGPERGAADAPPTPVPEQAAPRPPRFRRLGPAAPAIQIRHRSPPPSIPHTRFQSNPSFTGPLPPGRRRTPGQKLLLRPLPAGGVHKPLPAPPPVQVQRQVEGAPQVVPVGHLLRPVSVGSRQTAGARPHCEGARKARAPSPFFRRWISSSPSRGRGLASRLNAPQASRQPGRCPLHPQVRPGRPPARPQRTGRPFPLQRPGR